MTYQLKTVYKKYFQKSRGFLFPLLGIQKYAEFMPVESYVQWEGVYELHDYKLILVYEIEDSKHWRKFVLDKIMSNQFFDEYCEMKDLNKIVIVFDLNCVKNDFDNFLLGKYSKLSNLLKKNIRDFYGYNSAEWPYMESFLFPNKYIKSYGKILDVEEKHIRVTGELCDLPDLEKETLKLKPNGTNNDVDKLNMEHRKDFQTDIN
jgi:hypothetical protein